MPEDRCDLRPELAAEVKRLLAKFSPHDKPLSSREAADLTGLSHATVAKMVRGLVVGRFATQKLAERLGGDVEQLLNLSGYKTEETELGSKIASEESQLRRTSIKPITDLGTVKSKLRRDATKIDAKEGATAYVEPWSRGIRIDKMMLNSEYHTGDVLLIQEELGKLDGKEFLVIHNNDYETGFFISVGTRNYQLNKDGTQLSAITDNYQFIGKIVGCLREE